MLVALQNTFGRIIKTGNFAVIDPNGKLHKFGDGTGKPLAIKIHDRATVLRLLCDPDLYFGEAYMDGTLTIERGSLIEVLALIGQNLSRFQLDPVAAPACIRLPNTMRKAMRRLTQYNPTGRARSNVAHHYDLSGELYDLFLDRDRQYSCAYFENDTASLADAQKAKKRHLAAKLQIRPGMKVLDIGSGWGGLALYLAEICGADVTGVTLSQEQYKLSLARASQRGVAEYVRFLLQDYRDLDCKFDRIVSVGMFEHVGIGHYGEFFDQVFSLLKQDGIVCLHSIGRADGPGVTSKWINKYIFPGGYIPALSEVLPAIERSGLYVTDVEILRLHYAKTLQEWRHRFADHTAQAKRLYDERFCRMWEFYLAVSEIGFRHQNLNNFQIQMVKDQAVLPLTRDYIWQEEERLRALDARSSALKTVSLG